MRWSRGCIDALVYDVTSECALNRNTSRTKSSLILLICSTMTDSGRLVKIVVDYTETVDKRLPECIEMAKVIN